MLLVHPFILNNLLMESGAGGRVRRVATVLTLPLDPLNSNETC